MQTGISGKLVADMILALQALGIAPFASCAPLSLAQSHAKTMNRKKKKNETNRTRNNAQPNK